MAAITLIFILLIIEKINTGSDMSWQWFEEFRKRTIFLTMIYVAIVTVVSGIIYLWKNRKIIKSI